MPIAPHKQKLIEAFGQWKTIREWTEDSRCSIDYNTLSLRFFQGWNHEEAITTPLYEVPKHEAFGEWKNYIEWSRDKRCQVTYGVLTSRLHYGWELERALMTPLTKKAKPKSIAPKRYLLPGPYDPGLEAFGESKCLKEWAADPRCAVPYFILRNRLSKGWALEDAIVVPSGSGSRLAVPRPAGNGLHPKVKRSDEFSAFGERKTVAEWSKDPRCKVLPRTISRRLKAGLPFEQAITLIVEKRGPGPVQSYLAFGEAKTLGEWSRDARCAVPYRVLKTRLNRAMAPEAAITTPEVKVKLYEAYGERKSLPDWATDARCTVGKTGLQRRIKAGWRIEEAISASRWSARASEHRADAGNVMSCRSSVG